MHEEDEDHQEEEELNAKNHALFQDCLTSHIVTILAPGSTTSNGPPSTKRKSRNPKPGRQRSTASSVTSVTPTSTQSDGGLEDEADPSDLHDFSSFLAAEIWPSLPSALRELSYAATLHSAASEAAASKSQDANIYAPPLTKSALASVAASVPPAAVDTLSAYALLRGTGSGERQNGDGDVVADVDAELQAFLRAPVTAYAEAATAAPAASTAAARTMRRAECELCGRGWVPLTYHHLVPRSTHATAVRRGWQPAWRLADVAWLCRACHSFVHARVGSNEELARRWFTVELLLSRDDVQKWVGWISGVRWMKR